jgi:hypothetical protein
MPYELSDEEIALVGYEVPINFYDPNRNLQQQIWLGRDDELNIGGATTSGGGSSGGSGVTSQHGLNDTAIHTGTLDDAQAPQFLKHNGARSMTGALNMGGNAITNVGNVDGVDVGSPGHGIEVSSNAYRIAAEAAGDGLTGGGGSALAVGDGDGLTVAADAVALGTPSTLNTGTSNAVTASSHTHEVTTSSNPGAAASILQSDAGGGLQLVDLTLSGDFDPYRVADHLIPKTTDTYDIGTSTLLWRKGWLSELDTIIFAENTITLLGGWFYITKYGGTTQEDIDGSETQIDLGVSDSVLSAGDFIVFRQSLKVEYMELGSYVGANVWNVTRDVDGSGANTWPNGAPFAAFGQEGDGRIELNAYDTPRISILKHGATYNAQTELIRLGDLNGLADYSSEEYGIFIGDYSGDKWMAYDETNSLRIRGDALIEGTVDATKFTTGFGEQLFSTADGLLLLNSDCPITSTSWTSLRGQAATISGAFHQVAGRWPDTRALVVEKGTTNYAEHGSMEAQTGWSDDSSLSTFEYRTISAVHGDTHLHIAGSNLDYIYDYINADLSDDQVTLSVYVEGSGTFELRVYDSVDGWHTSGTYTAQPTWTRHTYTVTLGSGTSTGIMIRLRSASDINIDSVQLEKGAYATTYVDGSLTWGAWSGTAHESTSTRSATTLTYSQSSKTLTSGSIILIYRVLADASNISGYPVLLNDGGSGDLYALWNQDGDRWYWELDNRSFTGSSLAGSSASLTDDEWHVAAVTWDGTTVRSYEDGVELQNTSQSEASFDFRGIVVSAGAGTVGVALSQIAVLATGLTAEQVAGLYQRGAPLADTGALDAPGVYILDGRFLLATSTSGARTSIDAGGWFAYDEDGNEAFGLSLEDGKSWGGFTMDKADLVLGDNVSGSAAIRWDQSTGKFGFYGDGSATVQVEVGTDGAILAGGGNVRLDSEGLIFPQSSTARLLFKNGATEKATISYYDNAGVEIFDFGTVADAFVFSISTSTKLSIGASDITVLPELIIDDGVSVGNNASLSPGHGDIFTVGDIRVGRGIMIGNRSTDPDTGAIHFTERSSDPTEPSEGEAVVWMSDGTGKGDDGDVLVASKAGGSTTYTIIHDHSAGTAW